jgi:hypothetical protein
MRADLVAALQERWQASFRARAQIAPRSSVLLLNELLATRRAPKATTGQHLRTGEVQIKTTSAGRGNPPRRRSVLDYEQ